MFERFKWGRQKVNFVSEMMLGEQLLRQGDPAKASPHLETAVSIAEEYRKYAGEERLARSLTNLAAARKKLKQYDQAISLYKRAIGLCRRIPEGSATEVFYASVRNLARLYGERSGIEEQVPSGHGSFPINDYWLTHILWAVGTDEKLMGLLERYFGVETPQTISAGLTTRPKIGDFVKHFPSEVQAELTQWILSNEEQLGQHIGLWRKGTLQ